MYKCRTTANTGVSAFQDHYSNKTVVHQEFPFGNILNIYLILSYFILKSRLFCILVIMYIHVHTCDYVHMCTVNLMNPPTSLVCHEMGDPDYNRLERSDCSCLSIRQNGM